MHPHGSLALILSLLSLFSPTRTQTTTNYTSALVPKHLVYQYDPITWVENLAIRPNGLILPITTTSPLLNQLNPETRTLELIHDFSRAGNAIQGITQVRPDFFVVNVLTCDIENTLACTPGTVSCWTVDFRHRWEWGGERRGVKVVRLATLPDAGFINAIAALNAETVLMADSYLGGIWSVDIATGRTELLFTDASMNGTANVATGINGLRLRRQEGMMYFTNSAKGTLNRISIDHQTGVETGEPAEILLDGLAAPDDFEIDDEEGVAYVCNGFLNQVLRVPLGVHGAAEVEIAAELPGPTSVRWAAAAAAGRGTKSKAVLYASTIGGLQQYVDQNVTLGGAVYRLGV